MTAALIAVAAALAAALVAVLLGYLRARDQLSRFRGIRDAEAYLSSCQENAQAAVQQSDAVKAKTDALNQQLSAQKIRVGQYQQLLGKFHTATELHQRIEHDTARVQQLSTTIHKLDHAIKLDDYIKSLDGAITHKRGELDSLSSVVGAASSLTEVAAKAKYYENYIAQLKADVEAVEEAKVLQEFGFYRPQYSFSSSEEYQHHLESIRKQQKALLTKKSACTCSTEWTVDGSKSEGKKMVTQQIKLMLRAFNGECDAAVNKVRYNNVVSLETRIRRSFDQINKLGEAKHILMSPEFCELKFQELHLAHEYQQKKEDEREIQRQIREQMREEQKVAKEIEETCKAAEREQDVKMRALERAREELAAKQGQQTAKLENLVSRLENELHEALDRKAKAIARAQLTKSGHVYILSNIGTFGEGVYKIGMSRRLEPLERVEELGGASVPFPFDVHAMIYSENAPQLECALHQHFAVRRVNMVNLRREFFRVTLDEVRIAVAKYFGTVTFVTVPEAAQFRQTIAMVKDLQTSDSQLQIA